MYAARTGYRKQQDEKMKNFEAENASLKAENASLKAENASLKAENAGLKADADHWKAKYYDLRARALNAYNKQQEEIKRLRSKLEEE